MLSRISLLLKKKLKTGLMVVWQNNNMSSNFSITWPKMMFWNVLLNNLLQFGNKILAFHVQNQPQSLISVNQNAFNVLLNMHLTLILTPVSQLIAHQIKYIMRKTRVVHALQKSHTSMKKIVFNVICPSFGIPWHWLVILVKKDLFIMWKLKLVKNVRQMHLSPRA